MNCQLTNLEVLCFVLGWQGGTLEQVRRALAVAPGLIENANAEEMRDLCRKAQLYYKFRGVTTTLT